MRKSCSVYVLKFLLVTAVNCFTPPSESKCKLDNISLGNGIVSTSHAYPRLVVHYKCRPGYKLVGEAKQTCGDDGKWIPSDQPQCIAEAGKCNYVPYVIHAEVRFDHPRQKHEPGEEATVICEPTYTTPSARYEESYRIICNSDGHWTMKDGSAALSHCTMKRCPIPPSVPNASYRYDSYSPQLGEGSRVQYFCHRHFMLVDEKADYLTCEGGQWIGPTPTCVAIPFCDAPESILHGHWQILENSISTKEEVYNKYAVDTKVEYACDPGHKLVGPRIIECTDTRLWSNIAPKCMASEVPNFYCSNLGKISHGYCKCSDSTSNDLAMCEPFYRDVKVECHCDKNYVLRGSSVLTCTESNHLERGVWDNNIPFCEPLSVSSEDSVNSYSTGDITDDRNHVSTLVIVIATACSVLGVLLLIMVIVVFRRRKPRPHLFHPGMTPTPYSRVHSNSLDEHDRLALMAYADATRVHLPSYEEATRTPCQAAVGQNAPNQQSTTATVSSDYRPLPSIPPTLRTNIHGNSDSVNRHSTVTTSTMNRDGTSEIFGSLDTVNVSMSDASTSVTVETFDSGTSTVSISSQRATAGSLNSSEDNLAQDDAPLLDNSSQSAVDVTSQCSTTGLENKED